MHESVLRLIDILPPDEAVRDEINWSAVARRFGHGFPDDYMDFMGAYGPGAINDSFSIGSPVLIEDSSWPPRFIGDITSDGLHLLDGVGPGVAWGEDCAAAYVFWNAEGRDPNEWTVSVVGRTGSRTDFSFGMADFLLYLLRSRTEDIPVALFSPESPRFMHWREEGRLRSEWLNPWPEL
ncbi:hypothetical protein ACEZCY_08980 [Streptacidiphilus sp. N1-12]|uniref:Uncharacterized protein n=2 Tax=Streptacidiphilus alkalitolerans TaxID=3342712 RepID=A0ABV6WBG0_9ACTN